MIFAQTDSIKNPALPEVRWGYRMGVVSQQKSKARERKKVLPERDVVVKTNGGVNHFGEKVNFIWSVADLLRGPYRPNQYKDVMLPTGLPGGVFEDWWFIRPSKNEYVGGVYHYAAKNLMGSRQIFKQVALDTTEVMDARELYFLDSTTRRPLLMLHFVRMMPLPETEEVACYFYNRITKEGIRWVSYHFEEKAERIEPDPAVIKVIEEVEKNES